MEQKKDRAFTIILFSVYALLLIWIVLFKASAFSEFRYLRCERSVNFIPFYYETEVASHLSEIVLNVLVFVPFGIFLSMLHVRARKTILLGFALSLTFELLQFAFAIGAADVTDLITNTAGAALGACLYLILSKLFRKTDRLHLVLNILFCAGMIVFLAFAAILLTANG